MTEDDSFFSRWSRRKRAPHGAPPADASAPPPEADPLADSATPPETLTEDELAALPRIEDLSEGSDITAFLRPGVPRALKNAARRQVWMATPAIRDYRDPAVDYAWDWNTPGGVPGDGCAPSPERATRMLRNLLSPGGTAAQADTATPDPAPENALPAEDKALAQGDIPAMPTSEEASGQARQDKVSTSITAPGVTASGTIMSGDTPEQIGQVAAPSPLRRRHGGALPG
jgi:hypothetical protein